jgi:hypothetical protein
MWAKLLEVIDVDFDITIQLLIIHSALLKYIERMVSYHIITGYHYSEDHNMNFHRCENPRPLNGK